MRLHLCGPMRGLPNFNFAAFSAAVAALRAQGHAVTVPTEHDAAIGFDPFKGVDPAPEVLAGMVAWNLAIITLGQRQADINGATSGYTPIDGIALLPGWRQSEGAKLEALVAERCGQVLYEFSWGTEGFLRVLPPTALVVGFAYEPKVNA